MRRIQNRASTKGGRSLQVWPGLVSLRGSKGLTNANWASVSPWRYMADFVRLPDNPGEERCRIHCNAFQGPLSETAQLAPSGGPDCMVRPCGGLQRGVRVYMRYSVSHGDHLAVSTERGLGLQIESD